MKLILREDVVNLGKGGDLVEVKPGYGRNFLLPRGLAVAANPKNVRELEHQKKVAEAKAAKLRASAEAVVQRCDEASRARSPAAADENPRSRSRTSRSTARNN